MTDRKDNWTDEQIAMGRKIIADGIATYGWPAEIEWRPGEREKRETDHDWRLSQRIMLKPALLGIGPVDLSVWPS